MGYLNTNVATILHAALAPSTLHTYNSAFRSYSTFCVQVNLPYFPLSEQVLIYFVSSLYNRLAYKSIKIYLSAIQYFSIMSGSDIQIASMPRLFYALRGIRRIQGNSFTRPLRSPITLAHLRRLFTYAHHHFNVRDCLMLKAAFTMAYFGLLRSAEYTSSTTSTYHPNTTLMLNNITFSQDMSFVSVNLRSSKTDPFRVGCIVRICRTHNVFCPVAALHHYIGIHSNPNGPLFIFTNGNLLTRRSVSVILHQCFPGVTMDTHSFRIGGASAAASAGVSDSVIQILGRWSSDTYRRYLRLSDQLISNACCQMSTVNIVNRRWDPDLIRSHPY